MMTHCIACKGICIVYDDKNDAGEALMEPTEWEAKVKGLLKAELKRRNLSYAQLVEKLAEIGVQETEANIRNKVSRGKFTAVFLIQCLRSMEVDVLRL